MQEPSLQLDWTAYDAYGAGDAYAHLPAHGAGFGKAAAVCIGSRSCQRTDAKGVMCPSFRATQDSSHSTQHRAAMLRAALDGELGERPFEDPRLHEALDLCVACKGCKRECPNGVDMALLRTEALALGLGEAATRTAQQAWLLEEYLAREFKPGELPWQALPDPSPPVLVHGHCHQKAFGAMKALRKVLGGVPGLQVQFIDSSCCGMAGAFGYEAEHHAISMTMAEAELLPAVRAASADTWLLANGTSCRHQIHDGAQREARHLAQLLRAALPATPVGPAAPTP
ncbi:hypothetical protein F7Q92_03805 [Ideonella dechloratans]|uniref:4Fe-4S ferredoxin-type domain-containing protein n=1 Tax=Ideonella dechloratans TaxID=36863 RepID=A0A643FI72_IDEDE|nr:4Fe-4S dicluster domain-containing protein [Ideonella dechloratans]KAB0584351.1 hypothetical protein F7Q92_03805 [Ideonella dechloratans]UFU10791.1 4Fe-4S dicluster domain-containing protein [Ideonella dechloratans]